MNTVRQLLDTKTRPSLVTIAPDRSTYEALQLMARHDIGAVLVLAQGRLAGILTEREYARRIVLEGRTSRHTPVHDTMCANFPHITPETDLEECMGLMTDRRVRYLPVMEEERLVGLISIGDVVKSLLEQQRANIDHLERYITGV